MRGLVPVLPLVLALAVFPASVAQPQATRAPQRVGLLNTGSPGEAISALQEGLRELGYVEGRDIVFLGRSARGDPRRFADLAAELTRLKVDVIVATSNGAVAAVHQATKTIPIVMVLVTDPVALGFVSSYAHPGGNITGLSGLGHELSVKRVQLIKELLPRLSRLAVLSNPTEPGQPRLMKEVEAAAHGLGIEVRPLRARNVDELDVALGTLTRKSGAVLIFGSAVSYARRARIAQHATKIGLPVMCTTKDYVEAGCLIAYGISFSDQYRRAAYFVDRILKGANPGELPVEQPTKFHLSVNLRTARTLGLTIPQAVLFRADQLIE